MIRHVVAFASAAFFAGYLVAAPAAQADAAETAGGVVTVASPHGAAVTIDKLAAAVKGAGGTVFARIDHAEGAKSVGMELRPTILLIFGNPKLGTPALQAAQTMGMDLPLRAVAWEDAEGAGHLSYTDPAAMAKKHGVDPEAPFIVKMTRTLEVLSGKAVAE